MADVERLPKWRFACLVLKHLKNWSYEQLEWEVKGNLVYRHFCRIDAGKVPDAKTMVRLGQLLEGPALRTVFERIVQLAVARRVTRGRKMRIDTTVVETPIRYPSDSRLCEDIAQGVCREIERLRFLGVTAPSGFRNVRRSVTRRVREITHVSRRPIARDAKRRALQRPYRRLLTIVRRTIRQAVEVVKRAGRCRRPLSGRGQRSVRNLGRLARVGQQVVAQTKERVFKGNAKSSEKLVSIFETQTKIIRRGKAGRPTEFGQMVKVQKAEGGLITDVGIVEGTDHALLVPSVKRHKDVFGRVPHVVATDRGFFKTENVRRIEEMGVRGSITFSPHATAFPSRGAGHFRTHRRVARRLRRNSRRHSVVPCAGLPGLLGLLSHPGRRRAHHSCVRRRPSVWKQRR